MSQVFADQINNNPIYAKRAEEDQNGVNIATYYAKLADLAAVAFSGAYADLSGKPDLSVYAQSANLATVATTGDYGDLLNKPTIPAAQVNSDWNASSGVAQILNKPDMSLYALISSLATVATTGSYLDLSNLPTINNVPAVSSTDNGKVLKASYSGGTGSYSWGNPSGNLPSSTSQDAGKILGVDSNGDPEWQNTSFVQVQANWNETDNTDPSYIQNKPTIPSVPVQDVTVDGTSVVSNGTAAISMPTDLVPTVGSTDDGKVLKASYSGGTGSYSWETAPSGLPASTSQDAGKLLGVDNNGDPEWQAAPTFTQEQADWTESDNTDPAYIKNKPVEQTLVAGSNVTITEANNQVIIGASFTQAQADWSQSDSAAADYIKNKPAIIGEAPSDGKEYVRKNGAWVTSETVLYSGSRSANASLSETPVNFEYLRVTLQYDTTKPKAVVLVDPTLGTQVVTYVKGVNTWTTYLQLTLSASAITTDNSKSISFGGMNSGTPEIASVQLDSAEDIGSIVKVVGVNRIASN